MWHMSEFIRHQYLMPQKVNYLNQVSEIKGFENEYCFISIPTLLVGIFFIGLTIFLHPRNILITSLQNDNHFLRAAVRN